MSLSKLSSLCTEIAIAWNVTARVLGLVRCRLTGNTSNGKLKLLDGIINSPSFSNQEIQMRFSQVFRRRCTKRQGRLLSLIGPALLLACPYESSSLLEAADAKAPAPAAKAPAAAAQAVTPAEKATNPIPDTPPESPRTDIQISGVYPHLTTYGIYSQNGAHYKEGHNECGIGAVVPWAGKLWMVNYAPHQPKGSEHKLYSVDSDLKRPMIVHSESVGGTPAGRMIHRESKQLLIAHYLIDAQGKVRTISPKDMPMRVTAIARHLKDPANKVYYVDMEGAIWEANVHTLEVKRLFEKPVPGWHGKGGYTGQGRLIVSNNGELKVGTYKKLVVGGPAKKGSEDAGVLAEWDGTEWRIVERRQYTDITGPNGITGGDDDDAPVWAIGWDRRSLRLKLLEEGIWHTYLLPKAAFCNDARHGWYTEWPRIREITDGRWMMDMHGMFFDFPPTFSAKHSAGIKPIGSHLRYVPDFCGWNGKLVLASDETSIQSNRLAGQPQSNLWFGDYEDLKSWGPSSAYGGPWLEDEVSANAFSDPFLVAGFDRRVLHLATGRTNSVNESLGSRATDQQAITILPPLLKRLPRVTVPRGDWHKPAAGFTFTIEQPATVYLAVDRRGEPKLDPAWTRTDLSVNWGAGYQDVVYSRKFPAGEIVVPENATEHTPKSFGMPHTAFVAIASDAGHSIKTSSDATVTFPAVAAKVAPGGPTRFALQVDRIGNGTWSDLTSIDVPGNGYVAHALPADLEAVWIRLKPNRDCVATAVFHQTSASFVDGSDLSNERLFAGIADVGDDGVRDAVLYAAMRNRNLRLITGDDRAFEFSKSRFEFEADEADAALQKLLHVEPEFTTDAASVIVKQGGRTLRLPRGDEKFDRPFAKGWPRGSREVESERHLANIHGTFYEVPLVTNGAPPAFNLMRPVSSHSKQITDFCSWNGLLVLAGVRGDAKASEHIFVDAKQDVALWFGGVDDLWKLGKPVGRGGPWKATKVRGGVPSDPYLMKGYDKKSLQLSHASSHPITFHVEVDLTGNGHWHRYRSFDVGRGEEFEHRFSDAFQAAWVRTVSDEDVTATAQLTYQ